jgi:hypothetical protein
VLVGDDDDRSEERPLFSRITRIGNIRQRLAREYGTAVYLLEGAKINLKPRLEAEMREEGGEPGAN